ncbi:MAG: hypothetical protein BWY95_00987 [Bacteroidetes bacterium ADurb.BinA104]|nr:MAG: hypothetical protein BWY95_00987 [Bacteroidetes bacterium ADurb.BinA104]
MVENKKNKISVIIFYYLYYCYLRGQFVRLSYNNILTTNGRNYSFTKRSGHQVAG